MFRIKLFYVAILCLKVACLRSQDNIVHGIAYNNDNIPYVIVEVKNNGADTLEVFENLTVTSNEIANIHGYFKLYHSVKGEYVEIHGNIDITILDPNIFPSVFPTVYIPPEGNKFYLVEFQYFYSEFKPGNYYLDFCLEKNISTISGEVDCQVIFFSF